MDNDAIKKRVRGRRGAGGPFSSSLSSTKEIARAAVEEEFRKRRRRPGKKRKNGVGGDDYSSESDNNDEDDDKDRRQRPRKESAVLIRPTQVKGKRAAAGVTEETEEASETYRDRAKERREGGTAPKLNVTVESSSSAVAANDPDSNIPLQAVSTKGLDWDLVRKEREQLQQKGGDGDIGNGFSPCVERSDADAVAASSYSRQIMPMPTLDQARLSLEQFVADPASFSSLPTELSEYVMQYAEPIVPSQKEPNIVCGVEGRTLQRTRLVMTMQAHPSDRRRASEIPRELPHQSAHEYPVIPLLTKEMLESIERLFPANTEKTRPDSVSLRGTASLEVLAQPFSTSSEVGEEATQSGSVETRPHAGVNDGDNQDEDDDIFGGLDDYVPPQVKT